MYRFALHALRLHVDPAVEVVRAQFPAIPRQEERKIQRAVPRFLRAKRSGASQEIDEKKFYFHLFIFRWAKVPISSHLTKSVPSQFRPFTRVPLFIQSDEFRHLRRRIHRLRRPLILCKRNT